VFGDIGTSPLYAFKEAFFGSHAIAATPDNVFGVLSMMFWSVTIIVSIKYVSIVLRFDHRGEGGVLALLSVAQRVIAHRPELAWLVGALGVFAASLFYGDAIITPAISVLSAVEGLSVAAPGLESYVVPISIVILIGLFSLQRHGTADVGRFFGPVMIVWFATLTGLGLVHIVEMPEILGAINPSHAIRFGLDRPALAFVALGSVFLCLTGAEALYADMGHFGLPPIRICWFFLVFPALMINYLGQGALVLTSPDARESPFFLLAPESLQLPLVILATLATVIASQATISGAFSVTQQASRLNYLPRLRVLHTSEHSQGQIYIPIVNWVLLVSVVLLVLAFKSSSALAAAYGLAVSGDLIISSVLLAVVLLHQESQRMRWLVIPLVAWFCLELAFLVANLSKFFDGGWFPLTIAVSVFTMLTTWHRGTMLLRARKVSRPESRDDAVAFELERATRVPGTAVFFSSSRGGFPSAFLHNMKHNKIAHERLIFLTIAFDDRPRILDDERLELRRASHGVIYLTAHFGFREDPDVSIIFRLARRRGLDVDLGQTSFFTSKPTLVSVSRRGFFGWRRSMFGWMLQNSPSVADYFRLPPNRVVEMGTQIAI
ncbi:MAG: potassium transporter Kup, partial [Betaproteobacteria bacterium]|nr:potassium transporter Kup [Betaproteobacteria bacterium]